MKITTAKNGLSDISSDDALIHAVIDGDTESFALLVARYQNRIMHFTLKYEHNIHDAEDLVQETFLQAFRVLSSFKSRARFSTWLTGIAYNLIKNHITRTPGKLYEQPDIDDMVENMGHSDNGPSQEYELSQMRRATATAIAQLPQDKRDVFILVVSEGLSYDEAAMMLDIPVGTLKSRLCRARLQLANVLCEYRGCFHGIG